MHRITKQHDESGLRGEQYFGPDGAPVRSKEGYHRTARTLNDLGKLTELSYYDVDGKPTPDVRGFVRVSHTYDAGGRLVERTGHRPDGSTAVIR